MTKGNLALQMPSSYVLMDEEEMMYVEGGQIVGRGVITKAVCSTLYSSYSKFSSYVSVADYVIGKAASGAGKWVAAKNSMALLGAIAGYANILLNLTGFA